MTYSLKALAATTWPMRIAFGFAALMIVLMPEVAFAQDLGIDDAFDKVSENLIAPIVLGARGIAVLAAILFGLFSLWKAVKEASGPEAAKAIGLFFFALIIFNPMIVIDTILGLDIDPAKLEGYGIKNGF